MTSAEVKRIIDENGWTPKEGASVKSTFDANDPNGLQQKLMQAQTAAQTGDRADLGGSNAALGNAAVALMQAATEQAEQRKQQDDLVRMLQDLKEFIEKLDAQIAELEAEITSLQVEAQVLFEQAEDIQDLIDAGVDGYDADEIEAIKAFGVDITGLDPIEDADEIRKRLEEARDQKRGLANEKISRADVLSQRIDQLQRVKSDAQNLLDNAPGVDASAHERAAFTADFDEVAKDFSTIARDAQSNLLESNSSVVKETKDQLDKADEAHFASYDDFGSNTFTNG